MRTSRGGCAAPWPTPRMPPWPPSASATSSRTSTVAADLGARLDGGVGEVGRVQVGGGRVDQVAAQRDGVAQDGRPVDRRRASLRRAGRHDDHGALVTARRWSWLDARVRYFVNA